MIVKLLLINPCNPVVSLSKIQGWKHLNKYRVWKPLGLLVLARLTPPGRGRHGGCLVQYEL